MRTAQEIRAEIRRLESNYAHALRGNMATIAENAPLALIQLDVESRLIALHWALGIHFQSKLKKPRR